MRLAEGNGVGEINPYIYIPFIQFGKELSADGLEADSETDEKKEGGNTNHDSRFPQEEGDQS